MLTPREALSLGLKVDSTALPPSLVEAIKHNQVNLDDPAVTRLLIKDNAVLGVVGFFNNNGTLDSRPRSALLTNAKIADNCEDQGVGRSPTLANARSLF